MQPPKDERIEHSPKGDEQATQQTSTCDSCSDGAWSEAGCGTGRPEAAKHDEDHDQSADERHEDGKNTQQSCQKAECDIGLGAALSS